MQKTCLNQSQFECEGMDPEKNRLYFNIDLNLLPAFLSVFDAIRSDHPRFAVLNAFGSVLRKANILRHTPTNELDDLAAAMGIELIADSDTDNAEDTDVELVSQLVGELVAV